MATGKYMHLIKPLSIGVTSREKGEPDLPGASANGPGHAKKKTFLNGRDHLEGLNLHFSWGVHDSTGDWYADMKSHIQPYPQCLFFVGLDTANINYLGAEIEFCLGEEQEIYSFNEPTVIVIPAGFPHGPIATRRLFSPKGFGFFVASLNATFDINRLESKPSTGPVPSTGKYAQLIQSLKSGLIIERGEWNLPGLTREQLIESEEIQKDNECTLSPGQMDNLFRMIGKGLRGPGGSDHLIYMNGENLGRHKMNVTWGFFSQPGIWHRGVGSHRYFEDGVLIFLGTDPNNMDYLGAEIEIDLGEEHERYLFDKPSVIVCPSHFPHAPIVTRWVDKPFATIMINLAGNKTVSFEQMSGGSATGKWV
jgi:hypothetical protein